MKYKKKVISIILIIMCLLNFKLIFAVDLNEDKNIDYEINKLKNHMKFLTSDEVKGRLTGTEENIKVIKYLENEFKEIGLRPYENNSYLHSFKQQVYHPSKSKHSLIIKFEDGTEKKYTYGKDYIDQVRVEKLNLNCDLVYGIEDLKRSSTKNNIAILEENQLTSYMFNNTKAIFIVKDKFFGIPFFNTRNYPLIQINENMRNELINRKAVKANYKVEYFTELKDVHNVVGRIEGKDKENAIIISAHFDHVGFDGETVFYGAVDNASGTSSILYLAQKLNSISNKNKFKNDIYICAFNGEEEGLYGSSAFASYIKNKYKNIYNLNIDCIGKEDGGKLGLQGDKKLNKELINDIGTILDKNSIEYFIGDMPNSDHGSFNLMNVPAVGLIQENIMDIIHTAEDVEECIDYDYILKICNSIIEFIENYDGKTYR